MKYPNRLPCCTRRALFGAASAMGALLLGGCENTAGTDTSETSSITLFCFDTVVTISARCDESLLDDVAERCEYFEGIFSRTVEGSDIWNVNTAAGEPVEVAEETAEVLEAALEYAEASDGLFDVTIGAVSELWDFDAGVVPDEDELAEALMHVGWTNLSIEGTTVTLADPQAKLDLGGIAKGYIADDLVRLLTEGGCEDASISLGGNVFVMGESFDGDPWVVGIQDPNGETSDVIASVECTDMSVVTSGLYERCFTQDGVTYHHILDPRTGYPVETDLVSSSILSERSLDGDAYATMLFLMGREAALELLESNDALEGLLVDESGEITMSSGATFELVEE